MYGRESMTFLPSNNSIQEEEKQSYIYIKGCYENKGELPMAMKKKEDIKKLTQKLTQLEMNRLEMQLELDKINEDIRKNQEELTKKENEFNKKIIEFDLLGVLDKHKKELAEELDTLNGIADKLNEECNNSIRKSKELKEVLDKLKETQKAYIKLISKKLGEYKKGITKR